MTIPKTDNSLKSRKSLNPENPDSDSVKNEMSTEPMSLYRKTYERLLKFQISNPKLQINSESQITSHCR